MDETPEPDVTINKLYLKGFKSFQRQTAIPFFDGLTAIVGSNGSGKSNIMDALRFVMGRRSSKLRAEKMKDLIFNGGESRKAAEEAVVRLHLDNTDGAFDELIEEEDDEIVIGRKIKRNGYSTYRFQGTNCKRAKIDAVLDAAQVDPDGYHFIQQGRITHVVQETPVERRKTIDEISGIASYEKKKEKAMDELETVDDRLSSFTIKREMKKDRLENLREQKEKAERFNELGEQKERLEYSILKTRQRDLQQRIDDLGEDEKQGKIDDLQDELDEIDEELGEKEEEKERIEEKIEAERDETIAGEIQRLRGKIESKKDKIENKRERINDIDELLSDYENMNSYSGRNRSVKKVLDQDFDGVHGTVGQLLHYDERFGAAIDTALGGRKENIVVDNQEVARQCVSFLKRSGGRATFLPLDKVRPRDKTSSSERAVKMAGVIDYAIDVVDYESEYEQAMKHVLGDTLIAEDLGSLRNAGRVRAVTLDGDIMRKGGSITGGSKKSGSSGKSSSSSSFNPEKKRKKKETLEGEITDLKKEIGELNKLLEQKKEAAEEQDETSKELRDKLDEVKDSIDELREERKDVAGTLQQLQNKIGKVQKKRARFEAELDNIEEELENEFDTGYDEVDGSLDELNAEKDQTVKEMNRMGNVNQRAIDDFHEFKEEYDAFIEKMDELKEEKKEIEDMIADIEAEKRDKFLDTLHQVSKDFKDLFKALFDGGEAALELEDKQDIDSGLKIKAHPPDKEPHLIDSLSGGEKTLTAIAFIFALQEYRPSPFYLMDEIDAALDGPNSRRLSDLLESYAEENQVILISHNEETVRHADRAYGVSMRDGVSRVRSIDLTE